MMYQKDSDLDRASNTLPLMCPFFMVSQMNKSIIHGAGEEDLFFSCTL